MTNSSISSHSYAEPIAYHAAELYQIAVTDNPLFSIMNLETVCRFAAHTLYDAGGKLGWIGKTAIGCMEFSRIKENIQNGMPFIAALHRGRDGSFYPDTVHDYLAMALTQKVYMNHNKAKFIEHAQNNEPARLLSRSRVDELVNRVLGNGAQYPGIAEPAGGYDLATNENIRDLFKGVAKWEIVRAVSGNPGFVNRLDDAALDLLVNDFYSSAISSKAGMYAGHAAGAVTKAAVKTRIIGMFNTNCNNGDGQALFRRLDNLARNTKLNLISRARLNNLVANTLNSDTPVLQGIRNRIQNAWLASVSDRAATQWTTQLAAGIPTFVNQKEMRAVRAGGALATELLNSYMAKGSRAEAQETMQNDIQLSIEPAS